MNRKIKLPPSQGPLSPTLRRGEQTRWGGIQPNKQNGCATLTNLIIMNRTYHGIILIYICKLKNIHRTHIFEENK